MPPEPDEAQGIPRGESPAGRAGLRVGVVRAAGGLRSGNAGVPARPSPLRWADTVDILAPFLQLTGPGTAYADLSASHPVVTDTAALVFVHARLVEGGWGYATWRLWKPDTSPGSDAEYTQQEGKGDKYLAIWLRSEGAGRRYLVDCSVNAGGPGDLGEQLGLTRVFQVAGPDGFAQEQTVDAGGGHLLVVVETTDDGWYWLNVRSNPSWTFWSCEITRL